MSKKHKRHRHQKQSRAKSRMNSTVPGGNGLQGGKPGRKTVLILVAALVVIAAVVAYALNVAKSPRESPGAVAGLPVAPDPGFSSRRRCTISAGSKAAKWLNTRMTLRTQASKCWK